MKLRLAARLLIPFLILILVSGLWGTGCRKAEPSAQAPVPSRLSSTFVPNVPMDIYLYCKQESPTRIPLDGNVIDVESLAVWGVPATDNFAFGIALTFTNAKDASKINAMIPRRTDLWKMLSGNIIYLVSGTGSGAEALKSAISNNNFKNYDDEKALKVAAGLPDGGATKLAAIALAKPSNEFLGFISKIFGAQNMGMVNTVLGLAKLDVIAAGLYSPHPIDGVKIAEAMQSGGIFDQDLGMLILAKSGLPGFLVGPAVSQFLKQYDFIETKIGNITAYKLSRPVGGRALSILVRIEGNTVFAAVSGKESYAQTLITSVNL